MRRFHYSRQKDGILHVAVAGRMDTLTAPELLAKFQAVSENVEAIEIDAYDMEYISSAGLRVFMIMYKSLVDKSRFNMLNPNEYVTEILETSLKISLADQDKYVAKL